MKLTSYGPILKHFQLLGNSSPPNSLMLSLESKNIQKSKIIILSKHFNISNEAAKSFLKMSEYIKENDDLLDLFFYIDAKGRFHYNFYEIFCCKALTIKKTRCKNIYDGHSFYKNRSANKFEPYNFYCPTHEEKKYESMKNNFPNKSLNFNDFISHYQNGKKFLKLKNVPGYTIFQLLKEI